MTNPQSKSEHKSPTTFTSRVDLPILVPDNLVLAKTFQDALMTILDNEFGNIGGATFIRTGKPWKPELPVMPKVRQVRPARTGAATGWDANSTADVRDDVRADVSADEEISNSDSGINFLYMEDALSDDDTTFDDTVLTENAAISLYGESKAL